MCRDVSQSPRIFPLASHYSVKVGKGILPHLLNKTRLWATLRFPEETTQESTGLVSTTTTTPRPRPDPRGPVPSPSPHTQILLRGALDHPVFPLQPPRLCLDCPRRPLPALPAPDPSLLCQPQTPPCSANPGLLPAVSAQDLTPNTSPALKPLGVGGRGGGGELYLALLITRPLQDAQGCSPHPRICASSGSTRSTLLMNEAFRLSSLHLCSHQAPPRAKHTTLSLTFGPFGTCLSLAPPHQPPSPE